MNAEMVNAEVKMGPKKRAGIEHNVWKVSKTAFEQIEEGAMVGKSLKLSVSLSVKLG